VISVDLRDSDLAEAWAEPQERYMASRSVWGSVLKGLIIAEQLMDGLTVHAKGRRVRVWCASVKVAAERQQAVGLRGYQPVPKIFTTSSVRQ
jgi:hypothetical protein